MNMGVWSVGINGNDTAQDLKYEYAAAFYKYDPDKAVQLIDHYVRSEMFDESNEEEWCNYIYSLADFMWQKGILTGDIKNRVIQMIDSDFGTGLWKEEGETLYKRRIKALMKFKEKLLSPMPKKKKIKLNIFKEKIFDSGDIIAIKLQTAGKPYLFNDEKHVSDEAFHSYDGKYILMQLIECYSSWSSQIVPDLCDYWAVFRLFNGIYDDVPADIDFNTLKPAKIHDGRISSYFTCESSLFYFKKRKYQIIGNHPINPDDVTDYGCDINLGTNTPFFNPDSYFVSAMDKETSFEEYQEDRDLILNICNSAISSDKYDYRLTEEENDRIFLAEAHRILCTIEQAVQSDGKIFSVRFGDRTVGIITVSANRVDNLYIEGGFQRNGFGTQLLQYALSAAGENAYIIIPADNKDMIRICERIHMVRESDDPVNGICYRVQNK